ncbi:MAG: hypothetical protein Q8K63_13445 [Acidimicrobiales bacterium]|nr:hypothetical protein [Acidimicrobiales bacterium]
MQFVKYGRSLLGALAALGLVACTSSSAEPTTRVATADEAAAVTVAPTTAATEAPATSIPTTTAKPKPKPKPTTTTVPKPRVVMDSNFGPFLHSEGLVLHYPTQFVERVGLHESNKAGGRTLGVLPTAGDVFDLPSRSRNTNARTAADVLSDPAGAVRSPVSGKILRAGTYTLYCKYTDSFVVIAPDAHPNWEVKLLHISGLVVTAGQRVEAGVTQLAAHPTRLPFRSQVEDYSAAPVWPHVHLEVVDPSIKNPPGVGGSGCS